jgi:DNA helicase II / ATP-dependent DNA helicase PcrA
MIPTEQQCHVLDLWSFTREHIMVDSLAGTGKTTMARLIDKRNNGRHPILYITFAKRNKDEALEPDDNGEPKFSETTEICTINGAGYGVWRKTASGRCTVDKQKTSNLFRTIVGALSEKGQQNEAWEDSSLIIKSVGKAKHLGYIPDKIKSRYPRLIEPDAFFSNLEEEPSQLACDIIDQILALSIKAAYAGSVDFDDQIYMPTLFGGSFPKYEDIIGDEWQDFSPINHAMLARYEEKGARLIAIGDPWQSIYAFRGAVQDGMAKTQEEYNMTRAPLSVSFRCPSEIVKAVRWRVPHLEWSREGGDVQRLSDLHLDNIDDDAVVICRNNAPLFHLALKLLSNKRGVSVTGTDIGAKIVNIMNKLGPDTMKQEQVVDAIENWRVDKLAVQSTTANDTADCMRVFACFGKTLSEATGYAEFLFQQRGAITLTTGHKAKGLEWDKVYHLDPFLIRDKEEQEKNLSYVITTRSKNRLYEIESKDITA